jgi:hypothetical protein
MFGFTRRPRPAARPGRATDAGAARPVTAEHHGWNESASELRQGADVVEIDGDFATTVLLEHFDGGVPSPAAH